MKGLPSGGMFYIFCLGKARRMLEIELEYKAAGIIEKLQSTVRI